MLSKLFLNDFCRHYGNFFLSNNKLGTTHGMNLLALQNVKQIGCKLARKKKKTFHICEHVLSLNMIDLIAHLLLIGHNIKDCLNFRIWIHQLWKCLIFCV